VSVWGYVMVNRDQFLNSSYDTNAHKTTPRLAINPAQVTLWAGASPAFLSIFFLFSFFSFHNRILSAMGSRSKQTGVGQD
jgi:hypothetical protein